VSSHPHPHPAMEHQPHAGDRHTRADIALHVHDVSRYYSGRTGRGHALDSVNLDVECGEFLCVVGPSGCGKSTLLDILAGHQRPDAGEVLAHGVPIDGPTRRRMVVFQEHALFPWLSVIENVEFGLRLAGNDHATSERVAREWLERVHLPDVANSRIHELSGGMKQRVALARALSLDPEVLLMDEPFAALDAQTRDHLHAEVQQLWQDTGKTIVFVTHNVREAVVLGDRVAVMAANPGRMRAVVNVPLPRTRLLEDPEVVALARVVGAYLRDGIALDGEVFDATPRDEAPPLPSQVG